MTLFYIIFGIFCFGWALSIVMHIVSIVKNFYCGSGWFYSMIACVLIIDIMAIINIIINKG